MKILILTIEFPPIGGGASPQIYEPAKRYVELGHQVDVITMGLLAEIKMENTDGMRIIRIPCRRRHPHISNFFQHLLFLRHAYRFLLRERKSVQYDVIHAHFLVPTGILAYRLKRKFNIPYIITAHGSDVPGYNPDRFAWHHFFTPWLIRTIIRESHAVICPSRFLRQLIQRTWRGNAAKLKHIPIGIDTTLYSPGEKKKIILSTGRLLPRKGFQHLIDAVSDESLDYELHICGDGPMMEQLKAQSSHSKTPVIFHGWMDNKGDAYRKLLSEASIYCLVSSKENASSSLVEALSSGCAVITSNLSGCPESVGDAGFCIPPENTMELQKTLRHLMEHNSDKEEAMRKARQRAETVFDWRVATQQYLHLLTSAIQ